MEKELSEYLDENYKKGIIDHSIRVYLSGEGKICFYIHASGFNSDTLDFEVDGNILTTIIEGENK